jgi:hypothetical protein
MLGHPNLAYHLEFTHHPGHSVGRAPTQDNLLVFSIPERDQWRAQCEQMSAAGFAQAPSYNPYWDLPGQTFEDPDGYRVVLQHGAWSTP